jgi:hypothetical protein
MSNVAKLPDTVERLNRDAQKAFKAMCEAKAAVFHAHADIELKPTAVNHRTLELAKRDYRKARETWTKAEDAHRSAGG